MAQDGKSWRTISSRPQWTERDRNMKKTNIADEHVGAKDRAETAHACVKIRNFELPACNRSRNQAKLDTLFLGLTVLIYHFKKQSPKTSLFQIAR